MTSIAMKNVYQALLVHYAPYHAYETLNIPADAGSPPRDPLGSC